MLALYRQGPPSGMTEEFIAEGRAKRCILPPPLSKTCALSTYGVFVYQEQLMQAAHAVAGYTLGERTFT